MNREKVADVVELTVDVATIGGLSMAGIGAVLGITLLNPFIVVGAVVSGVVLGINYSNVKTDFEQMRKQHN